MTWHHPPRLKPDKSISHSKNGKKDFVKLVDFDLKILKS